MGDRDEWTDHEVELVISKLLLVGVSTAAIVVLAGGILLLVRHGYETPQFGRFHGEPAELRTLGGVVAAVRKLEARAVIQLGLGLLVATPVARVVFSLFAFIRQRDGMYVVITSIVLAVLLLGLFSGQTSSPTSLLSVLDIRPG
jgi:uncharacterized membrane protein